jgi:hypothetical protein
VPTVVKNANDLKPGDLYEDTFYHPCLCVAVENLEATGISLVNGTYPRSADIGISDVRKLTPAEAWLWRLHGPSDVEVPEEFRWWK